MKKRGQYSIELVITFGFAFLMIIPLAILLYTHMNNTVGDVNDNQAGLIARKITDSANSVYYLGHPSKVTLKVFMPEDISAINITGRTIIFTSESGSTIVRTAKINMTGNLSASSGLHYIEITAQQYYVEIEDVIT